MRPPESRPGMGGKFGQGPEVGPMGAKTKGPRSSGPDVALSFGWKQAQGLTGVAGAPGDAPLPLPGSQVHSVFQFLRVHGLSFRERGTRADWNEQ